MMRAVGLALLSISVSQAIYDLDYFDNLRRNGNESNVTAIKSPSNTERLWNVTLDNGDTFNLAQFSVFLPFSDGTNIRDAAGNEMAAALMAVHHFNNPELSPHLALTEDLEAIADCKIKLTADFHDTRYSPIDTTRLFTNILQRENVFQEPAPSGVIGAYRSAVTSPLAILTGVNGIPQVSHASTSTDFDVKEQYPYFGRTVTSSTGEAAVLVQLFQSLGSTHVGVLFVTDAFGSALQKAFQDAASEASIVTDSVAFSYSADLSGDEIPNAVASLKGTQFRHLLIISFELHYDTIMTAAYDQGLVGDDYLWIFDGMDYITFHRNLTYPEGSPLAKATSGTVEDDAFTEYARSRVPTTLANITGFDPDFLISEEGAGLAPFVYDAVTGLALSYCRAANAANASVNFEFDGADVFAEFSILDINGASGNVEIIEETGTRNFTTVRFMLFNVQPYEVDDNGIQSYKMVPVKFYDNEWSVVEGRDYVYAEGGTATPSSLPPPQMEYNYIGETGRAVGYTLMGIVILGSCAAFVWMIFYRNERAIRSSQPLFLFMVAFGSLVMASCIIPLSVEEPVPESGLDAACMAAPWLYVSGAVIAFSSLLAKTRGVRHAYMNPNLDFIHVTTFDILGTFFVLFMANFIVMITWQLVAPLEWTRVDRDSTDVFDRAVESYGLCTNDGALPFVVVIVIMNIGVLIVANWWAYQARNIETEYHESRYIGIAMASILQAWGMGIPILIVVWDNPQAKFFVEAGIIFVTALAVLLLIFIPKILAVRSDRAKDAEEKKRHNAATTTTSTSQDRKKEDVEERSRSKSAEGDSDKEDSIADYAEILQASQDMTAAAAEVAQGMQGSSSSNESISGEEDAHAQGTESPSTGSRRSTLRGSFVDSLAKSMRFSSGALSLSTEGGDGSVADTVGGIRVTHNPRSIRNLQVSGGVEFSRAQLEYLEDLPQRIDSVQEVSENNEDKDSEPAERTITCP
ncbi:G-protein coupled GABA receptor [Fragilaria crotonensis]|nr:G-protein coupled GABA receptor [Fragilaria crotonensis]